MVKQMRIGRIVFFALWGLLLSGIVVRADVKNVSIVLNEAG
jgi:hypothetical protein